MNIYSVDKIYESYSNEVERMQKCIDELLQENKQLKDNWVELKEFIKKEGFEINTREYGSLDVIDKYAIIEKMRELEIGIGKED